jgi:hypothetical protein
MAMRLEAVLQSSNTFTLEAFCIDTALRREITTRQLVSRIWGAMVWYV